jgi:hypothetical protein
MVASDLPAAVEAALQGNRFLSDGLWAEEYATRGTTASRD